MIDLYSPMLEVIVASLGWTLLHFVWQGAVVGVLFGVSLACASKAGARTRYHVGLFFLALLAALPVATFIWLLPGSDAAAAAAVADTIVVGAEPAAVAEAVSDWRALVDPYLPWTVLAWSLGVLLMTGRLLLEWRNVRRLTRFDVEPLSAEWRARVARLRERLNVHQAVVVLRSTRVLVPLVVGWLRPVILVPVSAFTGLTPWQLELILMHELAHVRRHDYLVNLLQVVVETLLFYHPVVRWVSRVVREERELCCDDLVVARSNDPLSYARALAELAGAQSMGLQTSVGSDGGKLVVRIKRLVLAHEPRRVSTHWSVGAMLAVFGISVSGLLQPGAERLEASETGALAVTLPQDAAMIAGRGSVNPTPVTQDSAPIDVAHELAQSLSPMTMPREAPQVLLAPDAATLSSVAEQRAAEQERANAGAAAEAAPSDATATIAAPGAAAQSPDTQRAAASGSAPEVGAGETAAPVETPAAISTPPQAAPIAPQPAPSANTGSSVDPRQAAAEDALRVRPLSGRDPEFPIEARLDGIEGWVRFTYTIGREGDVYDVRIVDAQPRNVFESAVRRAVRTWRFEPILVNGRPVPREMTQTIEFSLGVSAEDEQVCQRTGTRLCRAAGE